MTEFNSFDSIGIIHTLRDKIGEVITSKMITDEEIKNERSLTEDEIDKLKYTNDAVKKVELNEVILRFQALQVNEVTGITREICVPVFSSIIRNVKGSNTGELKICMMKDNYAEAKGGSEHILLVKKVCKSLYFKVKIIIKMN